MTKQMTESRQQDRLATDLTRTLLYLKLASIESSGLREQLINTPLKYIAPFTKELMSKLAQSERKLEWFITTVKKALGEKNAAILDKDMQPDSEGLANLAQLTEWLMNTSGDPSNAVSLVTSTAVRRDLMRRAWQTALGTPELGEQDQIRFNSWYNANFPH